jgi:pimeloyl-ACP methyl ester carboxylesterase
MSQFVPVRDTTMVLRDGRTLGYAVSGDPDGRPLLLFHGSPSSRLFFPDPSETAAAGVRLITVDRPGYGRSDPQPGRQILDWPSDVEQLVDALGLQRFAVAAHSSGGPYALVCAVKLPERVTRVGLVSCVVPLDEVPAAAASLNHSERDLVELCRRDPNQAAERIGKAASWLADDPDRFLSFPRPAPDQRLLEEPSLRAMFATSVRESVQRGLAGYVSDEVLERCPWGFGLEEVRRDVSLWHGHHDGYIPLAHAEGMAKLLPNCRTHVDPDRAHGLILARWPQILAHLGV